MKYIISYFLILILAASIPKAQNITDVLENSMSSVITVAVYKTGEVRQVYGFKENKSRGSSDEAYKKVLDLSGTAGSGSGFVINNKGKKYVITNAHVIELASSDPGSIYVYSINQSKYEVKVIGGDTFYDIAVLEFVNKPGKEISTVSFRTSDIKIGEKVYAIGNPLGKFPYSISDGIISGKNRVRNGVTGKFGYLQSTATIIWGNSGGPLIDEKGKVAGINSQLEIVNRLNQKFIQPQINFALEAGIARRLINDIINNNGFVKRAYLGLEVSQKYNVDYYYRTKNYLDERPVLSRIFNNSPSWKTLNKYSGYYIIDVNGITTRNVEEVLGEFEKVKPGEAVKIKLQNRGSLKTEIISVKARELNSKIMGQFAKEILSFNNVTKYISDENGLIVQLKNYTGNIRVLAAGISNENYKQLWKVKNLSELGAAIRFSGAYGMIDLLTIETNGYLDEAKNNRVHFSNNPDIPMEVVWY